MYAFGELLTALIALVGIGAACLVNAVVTYLIAKHAGRPAALWSLLALTPGVNVPSSLYCGAEGGQRRPAAPVIARRVGRT